MLCLASPSPAVIYIIRPHLSRPQVSASSGSQAFLPAHRVKACQALSMLAETEDFCTYKEQYYSNRFAVVRSFCSCVCLLVLS